MHTISDIPDEVKAAEALGWTWTFGNIPPRVTRVEDLGSRPGDGDYRQFCDEDHVVAIAHQFRSTRNELTGVTRILAPRSV